MNTEQLLRLLRALDSDADVVTLLGVGSEHDVEFEFSEPPGAEHLALDRLILDKTGAMITKTSRRCRHRCGPGQWVVAWGARFHAFAHEHDLAASSLDQGREHQGRGSSA